MNDKDAREMDVDVKTTFAADDETVSSTHADLDGEVAGGDGSGGLGKIRRVLCPPPIADVGDWGIPPESQNPCDPEVEVSSHRIAHDGTEKVGSLITPFVFLV